MRKVSLGPNQPTFKAMCVKFGTVSLNRKPKTKGVIKVHQHILSSKPVLIKLMYFHKLFDLIFNESIHVKW